MKKIAEQHKTVGLDDVSVEVWKCLGEVAVESLARTSSKILESERMEKLAGACYLFCSDLRGQMLIFDGVWHSGEIFPSWMNPGFHCTGQMVDNAYGVNVGDWFADVNVVDRVARGGGTVMVWASVCYGQ